ncbi:hypothetical protein V8D89_006834 [Ganoderma adspersum]
MSSNEQPGIQSLRNDPPVVQVPSPVNQLTVGPTSTSTQPTVQPTLTSTQPTVQPTLTNGQPTVQAQPLLANSQCQPLAPNFRFCFGDIATIVGAVLFICYVVWGIPLTVRFYKYIRGRLVARRRRRRAMSHAQDLERNFQRDCPSGELVSSSSTLQGYHERDIGQARPPLDDKINSTLDQRCLTNFTYPTSDSWTSISHSIQTVPRSPTQEFYSAPATPVPGHDGSTSSYSSSPTTLPGTDEEKKSEGGVTTNSQDSGIPPPASVDQPFGRVRAVCKPCM